MSDSKTGESVPNEVFEVDRIRELVDLMKEHDLSEIDLRHESKRIRVRRGNQQTFAAMPQMQAMMPAAAAPAAAAEPEVDNSDYIKSPMVGTFYNSPKPDEPAFVKIGDHVQADTVICLIEAMKLFNEIPAGIAGKIVSVVAKNEDPVDVGKPLFKIIPD